MTLGAFISSGTAGLVATWLSRRQCLWIACVVCAISNVIMMATENIGALYFGRFLIGLANGYFMTFSQLYLQETSPARYRGWFLTAFQFCTTFVGAITTSSPVTMTNSTRAPSSAPSSTGQPPSAATSPHT